jgi:3-oxoacyl-(acyl-carrier-protein) synthase
MFDEPGSLPSRLDKAPKLVFNWDALPLDQLLKYHAEIEQRLPPTALKDLNMERELLLQFHTVRALQTDTLGDDETAANQKAQVANTVASCLNKIVDMQNAVYNSERFKKVEQAIIRALDTLPEDAARLWLEQYMIILDER